MDGAAPHVARPRWILPVTLGSLVLVAALVAVGVASFSEARRLVWHRGTRPPVSPADSGLVYETVPFAATDGTRLEGWWIVPKDGVRRSDLATVILCHPEDDSFAVATGLSGKARALPLAVALSRAGFIVLAFDFRSYGGSAGGVTTGGWRERKDLAGAIEFAGARSLGAPLVLWGRGMGATVAMSAGAEVALAGAAVVQVLMDDPRPTWDVAILDRAVARRGALAVPALERLFVAREMGGDFDGGAGQLPAGLASTGDSALVVLGPKTEEREPAAYRERVVRAIAVRMAAIADAKAQVERADSTDAL